MIHALDCITLGVAALDAAAQAYATLLGRQPGSDRGFDLANVRLALAPAGGTEREGLAGLTFAVGDMGKAARLLGQRALPAARVDGPAGEAAELRVDRAATHQVVLALVERRSEHALPPPSPLAAGDARAAVSGLDHVVIRSPNPERAIVLYAGRLGLSLRLDRSEPAWGARLVFFRCGDLIVEVAHDLQAGIGDGPDTLWGLSWRVTDIAAAHARLQAAGVDVSAMRTGRRPGTQVFSVRSHTAGVPTLVIGAV